MMKLQFKSKKRTGVTFIEVICVVFILSVLSGIMWNAVSVSDRIPNERDIWKDIERISIATRLYRMEKGSLPLSMENLEAHGYIGRHIPPANVQYGFIHGTRTIEGEDKDAITVFAGRDKDDVNSVITDYFQNKMEIIILK